MYRRRYVLVLGAFVVVTPVCSRARAQQVRPEYEVQFDVMSMTDSVPLKGAFVRIKRAGERNPATGVNDVQDSAGDRSKAELTRDGLKLNETGEMVARLAPGEYTVEFWHPNHAGWSQRMRVPPPGDEDQERLSYYIKLAMKRGILERSIWTLVTDADTGWPIGDAQVEAFREDGALVHGTWTGRTGTARLSHSTLIIGENARVRVGADGYAPQEQTIVVGSLQDRGSQFAELTANYPDSDLRRSVIENLNLIGSHATSKSDFVCFRLKKSDQASLIVEVLKDSDGTPIANADVMVETTSGAALKTSSTDAHGNTLPVALTLQAFGEAHAHYRVRVSAAGYANKLSDIPDEMIKPGAPQTYLVQLQPKGAPDASGKPGQWTAAEQAAFDDFVAWARKRPPTAVNVGQQLSVTPGAGAQLVWDDPQPGDTPVFHGFAELDYIKHAPGDPHPDLKKLSDPATYYSDRNNVPIAIGNGGFIFPDKRRIVWYQGWFKVEVGYHSTALGRPTQEELVKLAREVAAVIGNPGY